MACGYRLDYLPGDTCSECGQAFDLSDPTTYRNRPNPRWYLKATPLTLIALSVCWGVAFTEFDGAILSALLILVSVLIWKRQFLLAGITLVANPMMLLVLITFIAYLQGTGSLIGGSNRYMFQTVNREYRCTQHTGHGYRGSRSLLTIRNAVLMISIKALGPMRGSYLGPYPDQQQAQTALSTSPAIDPEEIDNGSITVGKTTYALAPDATQTLFQHTGFFIFSSEEKLAFEAENGPITAAIYQQSCLIIRMPTPRMGDKTAVIYLVDLNSNEFIGYYTEGE